ncbi:TPA: hypothetical protein N0F65_011526 [Lagenidium giganteum]|uniref:RanBP2-type domain-containing protein n=1 Tax=Lagenidium giganteum TaxID=4803 RepID=A0AAV2Z729_9STRA|nr:TPA: hypothetical protein N0F65_011526 [Lagenidium giganteum]
MSRQSGNWSNIKVTNAKACACYFEISNVGKTIESSKKRVTWRLKVEEGREFEVSLTHSLASGKKVLRVDGIIKYTTKGLTFGDWDYVFNLPGGHVVHIIIKPSVELNDMYDLIIDGISFRRLPERLESGGASGGRSSGYRSQSNSITNASSRSDSYTYNYSGGGGDSGPSSRNTSFTPWECTRCTLVNDKPLAPVCEACGNPKPTYIAPQARERAQQVAEQRASEPVSAYRSSKPNKSTTNASKPRKPEPEPDLMGMDTAFQTSDNSFGAEHNPFGSSDPFGTNSADTTSSFNTFERKGSGYQAQAQDITSMLSGLDFTAAPAPVQPYPPPTTSPLQNGSSSQGDAQVRTGSGDLWESGMVDLNLREKPKQTSVRSMQTLEQARLQQPKEKVPVMPPPSVASHGYYNSQAMTPQGYYQQPMGGGYNTVGAPGYGMGQPGYGAAPMVGYGFGMGAAGAAPVQGSQQFMTNPTQPAGQPRRASFAGLDPFATLS